MGDIATTLSGLSSAEVVKEHRMNTTELLQSVHYVIDPNGRPAAVQMSITAWNRLLGWIEDVEDRALVKAMLPQLRQGPQQAGALRWDDVKDDWDTPQPE